MSIRVRVGMLGLGALLVAGMGTLSVGAQEPAKAGSARKASDPSHRVPPFFGQVGLSTDQREQIYAIRAKHAQKIADLKKQIAEAEAQELAECESVLSDGQRKALADRRGASTRGRSSTAKVEPAKTPSESSKPKGEQKSGS